MDRIDVFAAYREAKKIEIEAFNLLKIKIILMKDDRHAEFIYQTSCSLRDAWHQIIKSITAEN